MRRQPTTFSYWVKAGQYFEGKVSLSFKVLKSFYIDLFANYIPKSWCSKKDFVSFEKLNDTNTNSKCFHAIDKACWQI
jgi:hypothetical protein